MKKLLLSGLLAIVAIGIASAQNRATTRKFHMVG
jgi:hypothetical protein